jgi:hypothetical protein
VDSFISKIIQRYLSTNQRGFQGDVDSFISKIIQRYLSTNQRGFQGDTDSYKDFLDHDVEFLSGKQISTNQEGFLCDVDSYKDSWSWRDKKDIFVREDQSKQRIRLDFLMVPILCFRAKSTTFSPPRKIFVINM